MRKKVKTRVILEGFPPGKNGKAIKRLIDNGLKRIRRLGRYKRR